MALTGCPPAWRLLLLSPIAVESRYPEGIHPGLSSRTLCGVRGKNAGRERTGRVVSMNAVSRPQSRHQPPNFRMADQLDKIRKRCAIREDQSATVTHCRASPSI